MFVLVFHLVAWRVWEESDESTSPSEAALIPYPFSETTMNFTVMSYNILAQDLLEANPELYTHCPLEVLDWSYRSLVLIKELQKWAPDVSQLPIFSKFSSKFLSSIPTNDLFIPCV